MSDGRPQWRLVAAGKQCYEAFFALWRSVVLPNPLLWPGPVVTLANAIWSLLTEAWGDLHGAGPGSNSFVLMFSNLSRPVNLQSIFDR